MHILLFSYMTRNSNVIETVMLYENIDTKTKVILSH